MASWGLRTAVASGYLSGFVESGGGKLAGEDGVLETALPLHTGVPARVGHVLVELRVFLHLLDQGLYFFDVQVVQSDLGHGVLLMTCS